MILQYCQNLKYIVKCSQLPNLQQNLFQPNFVFTIKNINLYNIQYDVFYRIYKILFKSLELSVLYPELRDINDMLVLYEHIPVSLHRTKNFVVPAWTSISATSCLVYVSHLSFIDFSFLCIVFKLQMRNSLLTSQTVTSIFDA